MRFVEDQAMSFCMTVSSGIDKEALLKTIGMVNKLPLPQTFDDVAWDTQRTAGRTGLINVFEDGEFLITLEKGGFAGARHSTILKIAQGMASQVGHFVCILRSTGEDKYNYYAEVQDGMVLASFDPKSDPAPEVVEEFFPEGMDARSGMIKALEYRMETTVNPEWLTLPTDTYVIEYRYRRD